jgi:hypothetical protein
MTSIKKIVSGFLAALFMTGVLAATPATAAENVCVKTDSIENLSEEEHFMLYES